MIGGDVGNVIVALGALVWAQRAWVLRAALEAALVAEKAGRDGKFTDQELEEIALAAFRRNPIQALLPEPVIRLAIRWAVNRRKRRIRSMAKEPENA